MKLYNTRHLKHAISILMVFCFVSRVKTYEQNETILEKWYFDLHPDINHIKWPQVKNLTQKTHRKICETVFQSVQPNFDQYIFVEERKPDPEGPSTRMRGPVLLELKKEMLAIPIVECIYKNTNASQTTTSPTAPQTTSIYLTHANSSQVFTLKKEPYSDIFQLQSGLHPVSYNTTD